LLQKLNDNPQAAAEGASGAYKFATKNLFGNGGTGNVDFTGLDDFSGGRFFVRVENSGGVARDFNVNASDGAFGAPQAILSVPASSVEYIHGYWNKITGVIQGVNASLVTLTKTGEDVTTLRFSGATDLSFSVHLMPDGGESVT
jgi:hypothetical protein